VKYQDPESGLWYQVVDQGARPGNYHEATASSMFVFVLAKSVNRGYVPRDLESAVRRGYRGIVARLIQDDKQGRISLSQCCSVAGLGYGRDGSYDYYLREPRVDNDLKGVGPFILCGLEVQRLVDVSNRAPGTANRR
jgi:unsaturated rhamnogalacturonyl hydrolase